MKRIAVSKKMLRKARAQAFRFKLLGRIGEKMEKRKVGKRRLARYLGVTRRELTALFRNSELPLTTACEICELLGIKTKIG